MPERTPSWPVEFGGLEPEKRVGVTIADDEAPRHSWEVVHVGAHRQARHSGGLGDEDRRTWITWLRRFGIDPEDVLLDPFFLVAEDDRRTIRYLGVARNEDGTPKLRGGQIDRNV